MTAALTLARRGLGAVWPNPAVGCILVREQQVVGRGWTQPGGRPHAETEALRRAGEAAVGATAYVTLEPCAHEGKTPPCVDALIEARIGCCVVATEDPDRRVGGAGLARLRDAGIQVIEGLCREEARDLNAGYLLRCEQGRPLVTLKTATTLDGRIATAGGDREWITAELARARAHLLRAEHDAVMVGARTAMSDRPRLTCRLPGLAERSPVRVVADSRLRLPLTDPLVAEHEEAPTWIVALQNADTARRRAFSDCGVEVISVAADDGGVSVAATLQALAARGITRLLVEGGGRLTASLIAADCVDRIAWFRAASVIGGDGVAAVAGLGLDAMADKPRFERISLMALGEDVLETYARRE